MSERIQKFLSGLGYGSRREVEEWITDGRLVVNGEPATIGLKISEADAVKLDGKRLSLKAGNEPLRVLLYKKRTGEMVTREDPEGRRTVFRKLPELETGRWIAVGRLDVNTSGLLLMTNHGELARRLMHPSFEQRREYAVRALGEVGDDTFAKLRKGVELEDGEASFESIRFGDNEVDDDEVEAEGGTVKANKWFIVTITEGRHREVRRLFESQGLIVNRLIRTGYGPIKLGGGIKSGSYREASAEELRKLLAAVNLDDKELKPERVRESHRTKSDYSLNAGTGEAVEASVPAAAVKRGDSKKAHRAAAIAKREENPRVWQRASRDERKAVDRQERRHARFGTGEDAPTYRVKPAVPRGDAAEGPWSRKTPTVRAEPVSDAGEAAPEQFKARGFGAKSQRSYAERGDAAPATPTRRYRDDAPKPRRDAAPRADSGSRWPKSNSASARPERDGAPARTARPPRASERSFERPRKPSESKPWGNRSAEKSAGPRRFESGGPKPAGEAPRFRKRDDAPRFKTPASRGDEAPRWRSEGPKRPFGGPAGDRPASKSPFKSPAKRDDRPRADRPARDDRRPARSAAAAARPKGNVQRFVVKDGAATRPGAGKPKLGLKRPKREGDDD